MDVYFYANSIIKIKMVKLEPLMKVGSLAMYFVILTETKYFIIQVD